MLEKVGYTLKHVNKNAISTKIILNHDDQEHSKLRGPAHCSYSHFFKSRRNVVEKMLVVQHRDKIYFIPKNWRFSVLRITGSYSGQPI